MATVSLLAGNTAPDFETLIAVVRQLGTEKFAPRAAQYDRDATFPFANDDDMREAGLLKLCVPVRHGRRGNPVLWGAAYFAEMMSLSGDMGAKPLMARHQECVTEVPAASDGIFADVDTLSDLARLKARTGSDR